MNVAGVSIIMSTNKSQFIRNIFRNYERQNYKHKELILILNSNRISLKKCQELSKNLRNVSIFQLPEKVPLGSCLNFSIKKAKYPIISKFDDDDYYAPNYLHEAIHAMNVSRADVVGKRTHFCYVERKQLLIIRFPYRQNKFTKLVAGGTITAKKSVFNHVKFPSISLAEDVGFLRKCLSKGFRIFSTSKYNYVYMRRAHLKNHTFKASDRYLLSQNSQIVGRYYQFKPIIVHGNSPSA